MSQVGEKSADAVERLSYFMLKEAYTAVARLLMKSDPEAARKLFEAVERQAESALQRMHVQQSDGPETTSIATAVAERPVPVFDEAHVRHRIPPSSQNSNSAHTSAPHDETAGSTVANVQSGPAANVAA